jgi:hypothetical protein
MYFAGSTSFMLTTSLHRRCAFEPAVADATLEYSNKRSIAFCDDNVVTPSEEEVIRVAATLWIPRTLLDFFGISRDFFDVPLDPGTVGRVGRIQT